MKYRVEMEHDPAGSWLARVPAVPGCHTYGRTLEQARRRIREALGLWIDDVGKADLEFHLRLPADIRTKLRQTTAARERSARIQRETHDATVDTAKELTERFGLSRRDAAELLGLSYQRVQQLVSG